MDLQVAKDKPVFKLNIQVTAHDIDELEHVNNMVYLKWVLEAAENHWVSLSTDSLRKKYKWLVLRHEIDYVKPAVLNDQLVAYTWVEWHEGVKSLRQVKIYRENQLIAAAKTVWCLLDGNTMKPKRIENDISSLYD